jgi:hypothetical protein
MSVRHESTLHTDRLYKTYVELGLKSRIESGSRTISVAHFGKFEVRLIEFVDYNRQAARICGSSSIVMILNRL